MDKNNMDNLFEELLKEGASLAAGEIGEEIQADDTDFSEEHKVKMKKLFTRERRRQGARRVATYIARVASVVVILAVLSGLAIFKADALREVILNMFTKTEQTNTMVEFNEGSTYTIGNITIGYIPEGFELEKEKNTEGMLFVKFKNENLYFDVDVRKSTNKLSLDTENADVENIVFNGHEAFYTRKNNTNTLAGYIDGGTIYLSGNIDKNTLCQIFQHIKVN